MLSKDVYREVVKARAYGEPVEKICEVMNVSKSDVESIPDSEVLKKYEYLKQMGYINGD